MRTALRRQFPDHQGKYREFLRFWPLRTGPGPGKAFVYLINLSKFPTQRNRELFGANRELFSRIRELVANNREAAFGASRSHQCLRSIDHMDRQRTLKSSGAKAPCGFESRPRHELHQLSTLQIILRSSAPVKMIAARNRTARARVASKSSKQTISVSALTGLRVRPARQSRPRSGCRPGVRSRPPEDNQSCDPSTRARHRPARHPP
jgi:hypothetical protein